MRVVTCNPLELRAYSNSSTTMGEVRARDVTAMRSFGLEIPGFRVADRTSCTMRLRDDGPRAVRNVPITTKDRAESIGSVTIQYTMISDTHDCNT
jgi:hypothetical protein